MGREIKKGSTDQTIYFMLVDSTTGLAKTGLLYNSAGAVASYCRNRGIRVAITLVTLAGASAAHTDGGFILVDDTNMKGVYRLDLPDASVASGSDTVEVYLEFDGVKEETLEIALVDNVVGDVVTDGVKLSTQGKQDIPIALVNEAIKTNITSIQDFSVMDFLRPRIADAFSEAGGPTSQIFEALTGNTTFEVGTQLGVIFTDLEALTDDAPTRYGDEFLGAVLNVQNTTRAQYWQIMGGYCWDYAGGRPVLRSRFGICEDMLVADAFLDNSSGGFWNGQTDNASEADRTEGGWTFVVKQVHDSTGSIAPFPLSNDAMEIRVAGGTLSNNLIPAIGRTWYVSNIAGPALDTTHVGSFEDPFNSIEDAFNAWDNGDTIIVLNWSPVEDINSLSTNKEGTFIWASSDDANAFSASANFIEFTGKVKIIGLKSTQITTGYNLKCTGDCELIGCDIDQVDCDAMTSGSNITVSRSAVNKFNCGTSKTFGLMNFKDSSINFNSLFITPTVTSLLIDKCTINGISNVGTINGNVMIDDLVCSGHILLNIVGVGIIEKIMCAGNLDISGDYTKVTNCNTESALLSSTVSGIDFENIIARTASTIPGNARNITVREAGLTLSGSGRTIKDIKVNGILTVSGSNNKISNAVYTSLTDSGTGNIFDYLCRLWSDTFPGGDATLSNQTTIIADVAANNAAILSIQNNTRLATAIPSPMLIPATGDSAIKITAYFYDTAGNMEDPDSNDLGVKAFLPDSTDKNTLLYQDNALTTLLVASGITGYKKLVRISQGVYECYVKIASTESVSQLMFEFALDESAVRLVYSRTSMILEEVPGAATLAASDANRQVIAQAIKNYNSNAITVGADSLVDLRRKDDFNRAVLTRHTSGPGAGKPKTISIGESGAVGTVTTTLDVNGDLETETLP